MAAQLLVGDAPHEPKAGGGAESKTAGAAALGVLGVATISMATTLAAAPGGLGTITYYNHLSVAGLAGSFFGGVALVGASVWVSDNTAARRAAGNKFLYAVVPPLLAAVGLSVAALLW